MSLSEIFTDQEWEMLCDNCGICCFYKIEDEDTEEIFFTTVYCPYLLLSEKKCAVYAERFRFMPTCVKIAPETIARQAEWMPAHCAYRRIAENRPLPDWHPLYRETSDPNILALRSKLRALGFAPIHPGKAGEPKNVRKLKRRASKAILDDQFEDRLIQNVFNEPLD